MDNNYILARWRDASTDPPDDGYYLLSGAGERKDGLWCNYLNGQWTDDSSMMPVELQPGDQWLDITTVPGVPREAVQAAVDEIKRIRTQTVYGYQATGLDIALDELRDHTGVTPTEVTNG